LPRGFHIGLYALVPDALRIAVGPQGGYDRGHRKDKVYAVTDRAKSGLTGEIKPFASAIDLVLPNGPCFSKDGFLFVVEQNRVLTYPAAEFFYESLDVVAVPIVWQGELIPNDEESCNHTARVCRVGPDGKLYITLGQPFNVPPQCRNLCKPGSSSHPERPEHQFTRRGSCARCHRRVAAAILLHQQSHRPHTVWLSGRWTFGLRQGASQVTAHVGLSAVTLGILLPNIYGIFIPKSMPACSSTCQIVGRLGLQVGPRRLAPIDAGEKSRNYADVEYHAVGRRYNTAPDASPLCARSNESPSLLFQQPDQRLTRRRPQLARVDRAVVVRIGGLETLLDEGEIFGLVERAVSVRIRCGQVLCT